MKRLIQALEKISAIDITCRGSDKLFDAAVLKAGGSPCEVALHSIKASLSKGRKAIIATGFTVILAHRGETDGPPGSAVLAKHLEEAGVGGLILTDEWNLEIVKSVLEAAEVTAFKPASYTAATDHAKAEADRLLEEVQPSVMFAIERPGWNRYHVYHNMAGEDISKVCAPIDVIFNRATRRGILTVGIGDGGNEIGMGNLRRTVRRFIPYGQTCKCPCKGGIASSTKTSHVLVGGVSNWVAYAFAAGIAVSSGRPFHHDGEMERRLLHAAVQAGAIDSSTAAPRPWVDGIPLEVNMKLADMMYLLAKHGRD